MDAPAPLSALQRLSHRVTHTTLLQDVLTSPYTWLVLFAFAAMVPTEASAVAPLIAIAALVATAVSLFFGGSSFSGATAAENLSHAVDVGVQIVADKFIGELMGVGTDLVAFAQGLFPAAASVGLGIMLMKSLFEMTPFPELMAKLTLRILLVTVAYGMLTYASGAGNWFGDVVGQSLFYLNSLRAGDAKMAVIAPVASYSGGVMGLFPYDEYLATIGQIIRESWRGFVELLDYFKQTTGESLMSTSLSVITSIVLFPMLLFVQVMVTLALLGGFTKIAMQVLAVQLELLIGASVGSLMLLGVTTDWTQDLPRKYFMFLLSNAVKLLIVLLVIDTVTQASLVTISTLSHIPEAVLPASTKPDLNSWLSYNIALLIAAAFQLTVALLAPYIVTRAGQIVDSLFGSSGDGGQLGNAFAKGMSSFAGAAAGGAGVGLGVAAAGVGVAAGAAGTSAGVIAGAIRGVAGGSPASLAAAGGSGVGSGVAGNVVSAASSMAGSTDTPPTGGGGSATGGMGSVRSASSGGSTAAADAGFKASGRLSDSPAPAAAMDASIAANAGRLSQPAGAATGGSPAPVGQPASSSGSGSGSSSGISPASATSQAAGAVPGRASSGMTAADAVVASSPATQAALAAVQAATAPAAAPTGGSLHSAGTPGGSGASGVVVGPSAGSVSSASEAATVAFNPSRLGSGGGLAPAAAPGTTGTASAAAPSSGSSSGGSARLAVANLAAGVKSAAGGVALDATRGLAAAAGAGLDAGMGAEGPGSGQGLAAAASDLLDRVAPAPAAGAAKKPRLNPQRPA